MHESTGRAVTNKGYKEDKSILEKPMELKKSGGHAKEDKGHAKTEEDPCNLYENLECKKSSPPQRANRRFLWLTIIACLISMVALLLGLLLLSGKIGYGCSCSKNEGQFVKERE